MDDAVEARSSRDSITERRWVPFVGRAALALLSLWMLNFAVRRFDLFLKESAGTFHFNGATWLTWLVVTLAAGFLFGLAAWLPFTSVRYLPSRLLLAALVLLPLARFWWVTIQGHRGSVHWLTATNWFDRVEVQFVLAVLAGVAVASGFVERRSR